MEKICYLGEMISCYGGASKAVSARTGSVWKKFRESKVTSATKLFFVIK